MAKKHKDVEKIKELEETCKRIAADFENYKKRTEEQRGELLEFAKADFISKITPVLDNFSRAFEHADDTEFTKGVKQIEKQLEDILKAEGLEKIDVKPGDKFDHNFQEAISCEPNEKYPIDAIIAELESGWKYKNKVLKPAKVRVSRGK